MSRSRRRASNRFGMGRGLDAVGWWGLSVLIIGGVSVGVGVAWDAIGSWRLARRVREEYVATDCIVLESRVATEARTHWHRAMGRRSQHASTVYKPEVRYRYEVAGEFFISDRFSPHSVVEDTADPVRAIVERYTAGGKCICWYDPSRPQESFLNK